MQTGAYFDVTVLDDLHKKWLHEAANVMVDELLDDHGDWPESSLAWSLPPVIHQRALDDPMFPRQYLVSLVTVAWKLAQPDYPRPASPAEQLIVAMLVDKAEVMAELDDSDCDFDAFVDHYLEDVDHQILWDMSLDGAGDPDNPVNQYMRMGSWEYDDLFKPWRDDVPPDPMRGAVHPYAYDEDDPAVGNDAPVRVTIHLQCDDDARPDLSLREAAARHDVTVDLLAVPGFNGAEPGSPLVAALHPRSLNISWRSDGLTDDERIDVGQLVKAVLDDFVAAAGRSEDPVALERYEVQWYEVPESKVIGLPPGAVGLGDLD